ncbi:ABC-type transporter, integral membrane subunit [Spirochaeta thermophila DSM 6578]|uniref:ABC-type transporter, integral membrane subunit n=1 Tax=Winmispira thermophila (strain ATCC 700085 / DSM 6578 / Z-1203) TaxID=869211 RepID=G0GDR1_WINT7|nr:carbohydrate ABC transporter permease [Spirochaeta thermophila]AEJ62191.1 ABC-type transporter, integral membrane subunit [Spirochaeta thermophila DSM 6578]
MRMSRDSKYLDYIAVAVSILVIVVCLLPMLNLLARSLSDSEYLVRGEVGLWPKGLNFEAYRLVLEDTKYTWAFVWTVIITAAGTMLSLFMTAICAYPLTYDHLKGRSVIMSLILFTMYFNAGTIPMYLLLKDIRLLNHPLVLIVPYCLSVFNIILMRNYFYTIPTSLRESAEMDGANPVRILVSIYLPLSLPIIATLALFYAVGRWNTYSDALMFMNKREFYPISLLLYFLIQSVSEVETYSLEGNIPLGLSESLKAAAVMFATVPILLVYPWLQRYFIQGVTLGSIKE